VRLKVATSWCMTSFYGSNREGRGICVWCTELWGLRENEVEVSKGRILSCEFQAISLSHPASRKTGSTPVRTTSGLIFRAVIGTNGAVEADVGV
jgi:hypothetical protein